MITFWTKEAITAFWAMISEPHKQWPKEQHYEASDYAAQREFDKLFRWADANLYGEEKVLDESRTEQIARAIVSLYDQGHGGSVMPYVQELVKGSGREPIPGPKSIQKALLERLEKIYSHYTAKKANTLTPVHFGALYAAIKGEKPTSASEAEDASDAEALAKAQAEWDAERKKDDKKDEEKK